MLLQVYTFLITHFSETVSISNILPLQNVAEDRFTYFAGDLEEDHILPPYDLAPYDLYHTISDALDDDNSITTTSNIAVNDNQDDNHHSNYVDDKVAIQKADDFESDTEGDWKSIQRAAWGGRVKKAARLETALDPVLVYKQRWSLLLRDKVLCLTVLCCAKPCVSVLY